MPVSFNLAALRIAVAQLCQAIGWNSIHATALDLLVDICNRYLREVSRMAHRHAEQFGRTMPDVNDLALSFQSVGSYTEELDEYVAFVESVPFPKRIPQLPLPRESHLNFLKPGSREVVHRPVNVHEHLPPMRPEMEEEDYKPTGLSVDTSLSANETSPLASPKSGPFKRPGDPLSSENPSLKRARLLLEEEGHPLREISSVMMTTSGFISPAREGKLPEARAPSFRDSRSDSPQPSSSSSSAANASSSTSYPSNQQDSRSDKPTKKLSIKTILEGVKKIGKDGKQRSENGAVKVAPSSSSSGQKDAAKFKAFAPKGGSDPFRVHKHAKLHKLHKAKQLLGHKSHKKVKRLQTGDHPRLDRIKFAKSPDKVALPAAPVVAPSIASEKQTRGEDTASVEKLSSEPDKQKLNIFKKISKVKEDKATPPPPPLPAPEPPPDQVMPTPVRSRESTPGLVIDETAQSRQREARLAKIDDCIDAAILRVMEEEKPAAGGDRKKVPTFILPPEPELDRDESPPPPATPEALAAKRAEKLRRKEKRDKKLRKGRMVIPKMPRLSASTKILMNPASAAMAAAAAAAATGGFTPGMYPFVPRFPGLIPGMNPLIPQFPPFLGMPGAPAGLPGAAPRPGFLPVSKPGLPFRPPVFIPPKTEAVAASSSEAEEKPFRQRVQVPSPQPAPVAPPPKEQKEPPSIAPVPSSSTEKLLKKIKDKGKEHRKERKEKEKLRKKKEKKERLKLARKKLKEKLRAEKKVKRKEKKAREGGEGKELEVKKIETVPKITVKLGGGGGPAVAPSSPDTTPVPTRKIVIKPVTKEKREEKVGGSSSSSGPGANKRSPSPELARFSALITRPPKPKGHKMAAGPAQEPPPPYPGPSLAPTVPPVTIQTHHQPPPPVAMPSPAAVAPEPNPPSLPVGVPQAPLPPPPIQQNLPIAVPKKKVPPIAIPKKKDSPALKKVVGVSGPVSSPAADPGLVTETLGFYVNKEGEKIWICPACGRQDDGSPMIGCDSCDDWYHWVCVGIQVPPAETEDWYCLRCISKNKGAPGDKRKKGKKK